MSSLTLNNCNIAERVALIEKTYGQPMLYFLARKILQQY